LTHVNVTDSCSSSVSVVTSPSDSSHLTIKFVQINLAFVSLFYSKYLICWNICSWISLGIFLAENIFYQTFGCSIFSQISHRLSRHITFFPKLNLKGRIKDRKSSIFTKKGRFRRFILKLLSKTALFCLKSDKCLTLLAYLKSFLQSYKQHVIYLDNLWEICENLELLDILLGTVFCLKKTNVYFVYLNFRKFTKFLFI
jgi:hypothetical protein